MAETVYGIAGDFYVDPTTTDGVTGTRLTGAEGLVIELIPRRVVAPRFLASGHPRSSKLIERSVDIALHLRGHDDDSQNRLLNWLLTGASMRPDASDVGDNDASFGGLIIPRDRSEAAFFYAKALTWSEHNEEEMSIWYDPARPAFDSAVARFTCALAVNDTAGEPPCLRGTEAAVLAAFAGLTAT